MTTALWIIAICEVLRMAQNCVQLIIQFSNRDLQKNLNNQFIDSLKQDNREWVENMLKQFEEENA